MNVETPTTCPDPERLAEFIDGVLDGVQRDEMVAHLADCGECREVLAAATTFHQAELATEQTSGDVVEFKRAATSRRWIRLAASVLVAAVAGLFVISSWTDDPQSPLASTYFDGTVDSDVLLAVLGEQQANRNWPATRGSAGGGASDATAFRIGVLLADVEAALRAGSRPATLADSLEFELSGVPAAEPIRRAYRALWDSETAASDLIGESRDLERATLAHLDSIYAEVGSWAEASLLMLETSDAPRIQAALRDAAAGLADREIDPQLGEVLAQLASQTSDIPAADALRRVLELGVVDRR